MAKTENRLGKDPLSWISDRPQITTPTTKTDPLTKEKKEQTTKTGKEKTVDIDNEKTVSKFFYITEEHNEYFRRAKFCTKKSYNDLLAEMVEMYRKKHPMDI